MLLLHIFLAQGMLGILSNTLQWIQCIAVECSTVPFSAVPLQLDILLKHYLNCADCCISMFTTVCNINSVHVFSANRGSGEGGGRGETQTTHLETLPLMLSLGVTFIFCEHNTLYLI